MRWMFISLFIILCGILYITLRYSERNLFKNFVRKPAQIPKITVKLYFAEPDSEKLVAETRVIPRGTTLTKTVKMVVEELIAGPLDEELVNAIPSRTVLNGVDIDPNGVLWVDFSHHLSQEHPGGSSAEIMTVYEIVDTILLNFHELSKVGILIEGNSVDTLAGHIDCSQPFTADPSLIK